jgi:hypothetical protein
MKCDEWLRQLAAYGDGALPEGICDEIDRHITECPPCAEIDHDLRDLARICRETSQPCLPEDARRRIQALIMAKFGS